MPSRSSPTSGRSSAATTGVAETAPRVPAPGRPTAFMVLANYYSLAYLLAGALAVGLAGPSLVARVGVALAWLYLVPPLLARLLLATRGTPRGRATPATATYRTWWLLTQVQMIFN